MDPVWLPPGAPLWFPPVAEADEMGLVAVGGDLSPERLLLAYSQGIFPWYDDEVPPLWWSPDPRTILPVETLHVSRSLRRSLRQRGFVPTWNRAFGDVIRGCRDGREEATWILPEMIEAYERLHALGHAHSLEIWEGGVLVGGLYGVQRGALFCAESMFHRTTDASKVAVVSAVRSLRRAGMQIFDVQLTTPHLLTLGAVELPRAVYVAEAARASRIPVDLRAPRLSFD